MSVKVFDFSGHAVGEEAIPQYLQVEKINEHLIWEVVKAEQSNARQGTHAAKTKGLVSGGGKKPWRQKGTGRARQGSIRAPQWRGGGIVFGPQMRSYNESVPRKKKVSGLKQILAKKINENSLVLLNEWQMQEPSTQSAFQGFSSVVANAPFAERYNHNRKLRGKTNDKRRNITVVVADENSNNKKSLSNIPWIQMVHVDRLSALSLFYNHGIVMTKDAFTKITEKFA